MANEKYVKYGSFAIFRVDTRLDPYGKRLGRASWEVVIREIKEFREFNDLYRLW